MLGLPESAEGDRPAEFTESFFKDILGLQSVSTTYVVERAHIVPTGRWIPGAPPRPFLVKFLNFWDRDQETACLYENMAVHFYPDFSVDLQTKRRTFQDVRRRFREKGMPYGMLYPCRLRVVHAGAGKFFNSPEDADTWLSMLH